MDRLTATARIAGQQYEAVGRKSANREQLVNKTRTDRTIESAAMNSRTHFYLDGCSVEQGMVENPGICTAAQLVAVAETALETVATIRQNRTRYGGAELGPDRG